MNPATIAMVRASGRSWWVAHYRDGRELAEWKTAGQMVSNSPMAKLLGPLGVVPGTTRWEEAPKDGMIGLALVTPLGHTAVVKVERDHALFQLKVGRMMLGRGHSLDAHVIGAVTGADGSAACWAYETRPHPYMPALDTDDQRCTTCALKAGECSGTTGLALHGFADNVAPMRYMHIGTLSLELQGVRL